MDLQERTIRDFGDQWDRYTDNSGFYGSQDLFADMIAPFLSEADIKDRKVIDIGSGAGRIVNMILGAGAAKVIAIEPASGAFETLKKNTVENADRIAYHNVTGDKIPADIDADFAMSIGVIHHIPEPAPTIAAGFDALKPGGKMLIWLYGKENNRLYLFVLGILRLFTTRLPAKLLSRVSSALNAILDVYIFLCRNIPLPLRGYITNVIGPMTREKRYLVIYDQLNPAYAKYYLKDEAHRLLSDAGFENVQTHHRHGYSWTVVGTKPFE